MINAVELVVPAEIAYDQRKIVPVFEYNIADRQKGLLLIDLGQVTARSETVGLKPTSLQALYHSVNSSKTDVFCDLADISVGDDKKVHVKPAGLAKKDEPETAAQFSAVGISLVNPNQIFDFFRVLDGCDIPIFADQRQENDPLVIVGGASVINPIPFGLFADIIVMGQGEQATAEIAEIISRDDLSKGAKLELVSKIKGVYIPTVKGEMIDFAEIDYSSRRYPPGSVLVIDNEASIVISRSCPHHCAMCRISSAETFQRKPFDQIEEHVKLLAARGTKQVAVVSASASAYVSEGKTLKDVVALIKSQGMTAKFSADRPKLIELAQSLQSVVLAPEVSPRLRTQVLDKRIEEKDLQEGIDIGLKKGVRKFTFYSIIGIKDHADFKGETEDDLSYYLQLAQFVNQKAVENYVDSVSIEFSVMPLMPSPHTNLETFPMVAWQEFQDKLTHLNELARKSGLTNTQFITHLTELDFTLEALLNRSGVEEGRMCYAAYKQANMEQIDYFTALKKVFAAEGVNFDKYLAARTEDELLYLREVQPIRRRWGERRTMDRRAPPNM